MFGSRPAWRDERVLAWALQIAVALVAFLVLAYGVDRTLDDMRARGLAPGLGFLSNTAGFGIGEGIAYDPRADSYGRAFVVGLANTLRVAAAAIVLASVGGLLVALGRLSGNPLLEALCVAYVDIFRNTPLLVQLIFWYQGVILQLPALAQSLAVGRSAAEGADPSAWLFLSQRGLALARPAATPSSGAWLLALGLGLLLAAGVALWRRRVERRSGVPGRPLAWALGSLLLVALARWWMLPEAPLALARPSLGRFSYAGGWALTPEYAALLIGLVAYGSAFIAEVIRGGIVAVPKGQREAARAVGLHEAQLLRLVVLPQALRIIVPPLTNQYLNLVKNSSLAIYIGFPDLFNVSLTIGNNTGQFVVVTAMIMAVYLAISLLTSLVMNAYNRRIQLVER